MTDSEQAVAAGVTLPPGALLVRVEVDDTGWVGGLPAVPAGDTVTVSVSEPRMMQVPADDLVSHGYRLVGVSARQPATGAAAVVDLLVSAAMRERHPAWWRALLGQASRVFDPRFGPAARVLRSELALHAAGCRQTARI